MLSRKSPVLASLLAGAGVLLLILELAGLTNGSVGTLGFFFRTFHTAMLYIPLYLAFCALALYSKEKSCKLLLTLNLSLVPFLTMTLFSHIARNNINLDITRFFILGMGKNLSLIFLVLLFGVELALIYKLGNWFFPNQPWFPPQDILKNLKRRIPIPKARNKGKKDKNYKDPVRQAIFDNPGPSDPRASAFPLPEMPDPIPPMEAADDSEIQNLISSIIKPEWKEPHPVPSTPPEREPFTGAGSGYSFSNGRKIRISSFTETC